MPESLIKSIFLLVVITLSFMLAQNVFSIYIPYIIAALFLILYIKRNVFHSAKGVLDLVEAGIFTASIILLVMLTKGIDSPFFFLFYILLAYVSLFLEPFIAITTTIGLAMFLLLFGTTLSTPLLIHVASLFVYTPLAIFMGNEVLKERKQQQTIINLKKDSAKSKEDSYLFLSLILKEHVQTIVQNAENFMGDNELHTIKKNARRMKTLIDEYESKND